MERPLELEGNGRSSLISLQNFVALIRPHEHSPLDLIDMLTNDPDIMTSFEATLQ